MFKKSRLSITCTVCSIWQEWNDCYYLGGGSKYFLNFGQLTSSNPRWWPAILFLALNILGKCVWWRTNSMTVDGEKTKPPPLLVLASELPTKAGFSSAVIRCQQILILLIHHFDWPLRQYIILVLSILCIGWFWFLLWLGYYLAKGNKNCIEHLKNLPDKSSNRNWPETTCSLSVLLQTKQVSYFGSYHLSGLYFAECCFKDLNKVLVKATGRCILQEQLVKTQY